MARPQPRKAPKPSEPTIDPVVARVMEKLRVTPTPRDPRPPADGACPHCGEAGVSYELMEIHSEDGARTWRGTVNCHKCHRLCGCWEGIVPDWWPAATKTKIEECPIQDLEMHDESGTHVVTGRCVTYSITKGKRRNSSDMIFVAIGRPSLRLIEQVRAQHPEVSAAGLTPEQRQELQQGIDDAQRIIDEALGVDGEPATRVQPVPPSVVAEYATLRAQRQAREQAIRLLADGGDPDVARQLRRRQTDMERRMAELKERFGEVVEIMDGDGAR